MEYCMKDATAPAIPVLGIPVHAVTYETSLAYCQAMAKTDRPAAVTASNTHLVALGRHCPEFGKILSSFDMIIPDGMPLIWSLRGAGVKLPDRVYGPYFMRYALEQCPAPWKHFFFGGKEETLEQLSKEARELQPEIQIVGALSPPFRDWTDQEEEEFARIIIESGADFIWVALGGERQERWIAKNLFRYRRGVFFGVGDAFELLAGNRPFAPASLQRLGLTWLYRLWQEPRRLWRRYLKYNSLFLYYQCRDRFLPAPWEEKSKRPRLAFIGSRGVPARYAGFETVVEELGARLVDKGYKVEVFSRRHLYPKRLETYRGMKIIYLPTLRFRHMETIVHTVLSVLALCFRRPSQTPDLVYLCGVGNAVVAPLLHLRGIRVVANVDGIDFKREKWGAPAQVWLWFSERIVPKLADRVVADNLTVVHHYERQHKFTPEYISYGSPAPNDSIGTMALQRLGLEPNKYLLLVGRLSRENAVELALKAYARTDKKFPLVVVGGVGYEEAYSRELRALAGPGVIFAGGVYGEGYQELSQHCLCFILPATIEATRLVLLDQMGFGNAIIFHDCEATREVIGSAGEPFAGHCPEESLHQAMEKLMVDPELCGELGQLARQRALRLYSWEAITNQYMELFAPLLPARSRSTT